MNPMTLGFYTTLVLEAAEWSLREGQKLASGATLGTAVELKQLVNESLGASAAAQYGLC